jgi:hypothetical protein
VEALAGIKQELSEICDWLDERGDFDAASKLIPLVDRLTHLLIEIEKNNRA